MADAPAQNSQPGNGVNMDEARRKRARRFRIFGSILVVVAVVGAGYWWLTRNDESTDDAFLEADVANIASRVDGPVVAVNFHDFQWVNKGQVLVEIDPTDYDVAVASAKANLATAEAQERNAEADLDLVKVTASAGVDEAKNALDQLQHQVAAARQQSDAAEADAVRAAADVKRYADLLKTSDASRQRYEQALADARGSEARQKAAEATVVATQAQVAQAQARLADANAAPQRIAMKEAQLAIAKAGVAQAQAALRQAQLNLSYTKIVAPVSGRVTKRSVEPGNVIQRGQILTNLVADPLWVVANFKETQLDRMLPGQPVKVRVDAMPELKLNGHVDTIQPGSGSRFALLPPENATGNYVKVVQRVPVKIVLDGLDPETMHRLGPGMSVVPTVDVGAPGAAKVAQK
jgi:membrane fusion protein (multidrug efflux system)